MFTGHVETNVDETFTRTLFYSANKLKDTIDNYVILKYTNNEKLQKIRKDTIQKRYKQNANKRKDKKTHLTLVVWGAYSVKIDEAPIFIGDNICHYYSDD